LSSLDERIDLAVDWLLSMMTLDAGHAGWGWVTDIPPNPQNTSEVVCVLSDLGRSIPNSDEVCALVRRDAVALGHDGSWAFDSILDRAWRIRALLALDIPASDDDVVSGVQGLIASQDPELGGWGLSGAAGPLSVTATAAAVHSLVSAANDDEQTIRAAAHGTRFLIDLVLGDDTRAKPLYAVSFVASLLARSEIASLGGRRIERAREMCVEKMLGHVAHHETRVEEERFQRGDVRDNWRHLSLHLSIAALGAAGEPGVLFEPVFRRALVDLLDLQEVDEGISNRGGFRTSREGFVTSYATTQALEAMAQVRQAINHRLNPGLMYDVVCSAQGDHHSDPQEIVRVGHHRVTMNSGAGNIGLVSCGLGGLTILVLAVVFAAELGPIAYRGLVIWGACLVALGVFVVLATRLVRFRRRIPAWTFAGFTALVLPVLTFLLA
jgi:hypothetical protein